MLDAPQNGGEMPSQTLQGQKQILGYTQTIDKPTYIINNSKQCIVLIFWTNQNVISKYGVDASPFDKCHHNIIYGKINIRVPLPPVFIYKVCSYSKADVQNVQKALLDFNWRKSFESFSVDSKVDILNETLFNSFLETISQIKNEI